MPLISALLFGTASSLDALLVGISMGLRKIRIYLWQNLLISLVTLIGTCLSVAVGEKLAPLLPRSLVGYAGSIVLILLGIYYILKWFPGFIRQHRKIFTNGIIQVCHTEKSFLKISEILLLSFTLSANNMGMGLAASMAGLPLLPAAAATVSCSILFLFLGNRLGGTHLLLFLRNQADPISGILLIVLGIFQIL